MPDDNQLLHKKIDQIESRLESHVVKIEQRLDQIVDIMRQVASLQERESRNSDNISELKGTLKDSLEKFTHTIQRVHERMDRMEKETDATKLDGTKSVDATKTEFYKVVEEFKKEEEKTHKEIEKSNRELEEKVSKWQNRGIGIWMAASIFLVVIQAIGGFILNSMKEDYQTMKSQITELQKRVNENDQNLSTLWSDLRNRTK